MALILIMTFNDARLFVSDYESPNEVDIHNNIINDDLIVEDIETVKVKLNFKKEVLSRH